MGRLQQGALGNSKFSVVESRMHSKGDVWGGQVKPDCVELFDGSLGLV